jgi:hypothetical protein
MPFSVGGAEGLTDYRGAGTGFRFGTRGVLDVLWGPQFGPGPRESMVEECSPWGNLTKAQPDSEAEFGESSVRSPLTAKASEPQKAEAVFPAFAFARFQTLNRRTDSCPLDRAIAG